VSRSNYDDECDGWELIRWRGAVNSAIKGQRGQQFLRELIAGMDAMTHKRLIVDELEVRGEFCALGVVGASRGLDMATLDPENTKAIAERFNIAKALALEIAYVNDELGSWEETPERRWIRVRRWASQQIEGGAS
jgi:hypothetical protein